MVFDTLRSTTAASVRRRNRRGALRPMAATLRSRSCTRRCAFCPRLAARAGTSLADGADAPSRQSATGWTVGASLLATDVEFVRAGVPALAIQLKANASPRLLERVERYVAGINQGLESTRVAPPEFLLIRSTLEPWADDDVFAVAALTAFESARNHREELLRLALRGAVPDDQRFTVFLPDEPALPEYPSVVSAQVALGLHRQTAQAVAELQPLLAGLSLGSNGWAVSPRRSDSGHALFAFDSHDAFSAPNLLFENHLFYRETADRNASGAERSIRGWSVPGLPGVINGFNQHIAWGFTNSGDSQDLFLERRDANGQFVGRSASYSARIERVEIPVRDAPVHVHETVITENGRLISENPPVALCWIGHDVHGFGLYALIDLNTATDWPTFVAAIDGFAAPSANATYADTRGNIGSHTVGALPVRGIGQGLVPLAAEHPQSGWSGSIPKETLPSSLNPERGFVAATNAAVNPGEPLVSAENAPAWRMHRLVEVLSRSEPVDVQAMDRLQVDRWNKQAEALLAVLLTVL